MTLLVEQQPYLVVTRGDQRIDMHKARMQGSSTCTSSSGIIMNRLSPAAAGSKVNRSSRLLPPVTVLGANTSSSKCLLVLQGARRQLALQQRGLRPSLCLSAAAAAGRFLV